MANIAIYHPIIRTGGGEAVCMNVIEALQDNHDLTLYTLSDVDVDFLNQYFNTTVRIPLAITDGGLAGTALKKSYQFWDAITESGLGRLHASIFGATLRDEFAEYDLVVSTFGEFNFGTCSLQYIHYPMFNRRAIPDDIESRGFFRRVYDDISDIVSGHYRHTPENATLLANSEWTANLTEIVHGIKPTPVYPPVDTTGFDPHPWDEREAGFVAIGRIDASKRIKVIIEIVARLNEMGHDVPLHILGPPEDEEYYEQIRERVAETNCVILEGSVSREQLIEFVCTYRYGIHGMRNEHFGIAVAEFVAGGAIPFVHDSGGQREIVGQEELLRYTSVSDAVNKIDRVLSNDKEQARLRKDLTNVEDAFGKERFKQTVDQLVETELEG